jgi:hypothetical protein
VREFWSPTDDEYPGPCLLEGKCSVGTVTRGPFAGFEAPVNAHEVEPGPGFPSTSFAVMSTSDFTIGTETGVDLDVTTLQSAIHTASLRELPTSGLWELDFDFAFLTVDNPGNGDDFAAVELYGDLPPFDGVIDHKTEIFRVSRSDVGTTYPSFSCGTAILGGTGESVTYDSCTDDGDPSDGDHWINTSVDLTPFLGSAVMVYVVVSEGDHSVSEGQIPADVDDGFPATFLFDNLQSVQRLEEEGLEGSPVMVDLALEPGASSPTFAWDFSNVPVGCVVADGSTQTPNFTCSDEAQFNVAVFVSWLDEYSSTETSEAWGTVTIVNAPPAVTDFSGFPTDPIQVGSALSAVGGAFTDPGTEDLHTAMIDWGDGSPFEPVAVDPTTRTVGPASHSYTNPGVYAPTLIVTDDAGASDEKVFEYVTVFDPSGGFVTGGGWIDSPPGAYLPDLTAGGKASFGFMSKYLRGRSVPTGNTQFKFRAADLDFQSTSYEWLIVGGPNARFRGVGTIGGVGNFGFMVSATDGALTGGGDEDRFRIQIWDRDNGDALIYDNEVGNESDADPTTILGGGSIIIHRVR